MTLRSDSLPDLLADLKALKAMIKAAKAQHQSSRTESPSAAADDTQSPDTQRCAIHNIDMPRRISRRTGGSYFSHVLPDNSLCYGRPKKA